MFFTRFWVIWHILSQPESCKSIPEVMKKVDIHWHQTSSLKLPHLWKDQLFSGHEMTTFGRISELYDDNIVTCFNKTRQLSCKQSHIIDMFDLSETKSSRQNDKAIVKMSVQDVATCSPNWFNVIATDSTKSAKTAIKCELDADYSVNDGVCFWRCPCDGNCTVALVQNPEIIAWNLCELRVF